MAGKMGLRRDVPDPSVKFRGAYWWRLKGEEKRTWWECPHKHENHDMAANCAQRPVMQLMRTRQSPDIVEGGWVVLRTGKKGEWETVK